MTDPKKRPPRRARAAQSARLAADAAAKGLPPPGKGQPTALTKGVADTIIGALALGAYLETAIAVAGIGKSTFHEWLKRGHAEKKRRQRHDDDMANVRRKTKRYAVAVTNEAVERSREEPYVVFTDAVTRAVAAAEVEGLGIIARVARGSVLTSKTTTTDPATGHVRVQETFSNPDWKAAAWRLERRHPKKWGRRLLEVSSSMDAAAVDAGAVESIANGADPSSGETVTSGSGARARLASALAKLTGSLKDVPRAPTAHQAPDEGLSTGEQTALEGADDDHPA